MASLERDRFHVRHQHPMSVSLSTGACFLGILPSQLCQCRVWMLFVYLLSVCRYSHMEVRGQLSENRLSHVIMWVPSIRLKLTDLGGKSSLPALPGDL